MGLNQSEERKSYARKSRSKLYLNELNSRSALYYITITKSARVSQVDLIFFYFIWKFSLDCAQELIVEDSHQTKSTCLLV